MKRKLTNILCLILAMVMVFSLAACGGGGENKPADEGGKDPVNQPADQTGTTRDTLNLSFLGVVSSLDPSTSAMTIDLELYHQIYESFYYIDDYNQPHSRLALSHTISDDGMTYVFTMREDAYFHNGDQVTAADAVFSFQRAMESGVLAPYVNGIESVEATGDFEVTIKLVQPYTPFLANTANVVIYSKRAFEEAGDNFGSAPSGAGTGPYMVKSYDGNTLVELEAFDKYYRGEAPIKYVNYIIMSDANARLIAFEKGELDFVAVPNANWSEIESSGKYTTTLNPTSHISYMMINPKTDGPLSNQDVRYAFQYAIDRDMINMLAYEGMADPAYHMMHPEYIFGASDDTFKFEYNPEKAKEYLAKAGYPDGVDIGEIQYTTANYFPKIAQAVQSQLAAVGIKCEIVGGQTSDLVVGWRAGEFNVMTSGFNAVLDYDFFTRYSSPAISTSFVKFEGSEYDADWIVEMYNKGAAELDPEKRIEIYTELENYLAATGCYVPFFYKTLPYAWNKDLNVKMDLNYYYLYEWSWN